MRSRQAGRVALLMLLSMIALVFASSIAQAAQQRYDYDALGRLVRVVDDQGRVTDYVYDAAGNILRVVRGAPAQAPVVTAVTPNVLRRGQTVAMRIDGTGLSGVTVTPADAELTVSNLHATATQLTFSLSASASASLGAQTLVLSSASGTANAVVTVQPGLPTLSVEPVPLAIPPDKTARPFTIRLSNADSVAHTIALSVSNAKATVAPASVTIAANSTTATANITGLEGGQTTLTLASPTLGTTLVPVYVTGEFRGLNTSQAQHVGVIREGAPVATVTITPLVAPLVGVALGAYVHGISPTAFIVGSGPTTLTITGAGLSAVQSVQVVPNTGVTLGGLSVAADGRSATVPLTVAANAPTTVRQVKLVRADGTALPALAGADRIRIVMPPPQIDSITPINAVTGETIALRVLGRNLHDGRIAFTPAAGLTVDATPTINAAGTQLDAGVAIASNAAPGARTLIVTTPGGSSSSTASAANTLTIGSTLKQTVTPIVSSVVGVLLQGGAQAQRFDAYASLVGVSLGAVVTSLAPAAGQIAQTVTLTLQGYGLNGATAVQFAPATGLTLGTLSVAADGRSASVPVTIAADAPQTVRAVKLLAGAALVPFASPAAAQFRVTAPLPQIDSITPINVRLGSGATALVVRGRNFHNATAVRIDPPAGVTVSAPPAVNGDATEVVVNIDVAANATAGARTVIVVTPAGESSSVQWVANTLTLAANLSPSYTPIVAPLVGVTKQGGPTATTYGPIVSPAVGAVLQGAVTPVTQTFGVNASHVGVAVGPVAFGVTPSGFAPGASGMLTVTGYALGAITDVSIVPATGITLGGLSVSADGRTLTVPITVAAGAQQGVRSVVLASASGAIRYADANAGRIRVGPGVPTLDSITPIVAAQGATVGMVIRGMNFGGANFSGATAVTVTPGTGITVSTTPVVNAAGTQLDVGIAIDANAPLGSRVVQVHVPGASSSAVAAPNNTLTVIQP